MRVAAVQMTSMDDKAANLATAARLVRDAAEAGARLVVLPEMFNCLGPGAVLRDGAEPLDGPTSRWAVAQAREHELWLVAGSFVERAGARTHNTSVLVAPDGAVAAVYRKIHLFDVDVPGATFRESDAVEPGTDIVTATLTGEGVEGAARDRAPTLGLSVCYDLRFPELYRILALRGADVVSLPAAFTATTGPPHWEVLVRARAIEDQVFVVAAGQCGATNEALRWHGHSMVVDPWGTVLAAADPAQGETVVVAELDFDAQADVRRRLPSLANRRPDTYVWPARGTNPDGAE